MSPIDLPALRSAPVATDPFPHVVVPRFVPPDVLGAVIAGLPDIAGGGSFPTASLRLGAAAADLMRAMEGPGLRAEIAAKFGLDLDGAPTMVTLRGRARARDGKIHCDSGTKRVTVLLYLNPSTADWAARGGSLRLLRSPDDLEDYAVEVPPTDGTLLVFPNGPTAWHGHKSFEGRRYVVQLNYMTADAAARSELRRHKFSAFVKRFRLAA
jgi:hypothetical protein